MPRNTKPLLAKAILAASATIARETESLADETHRNQPNLLMAVLAAR